MLFEYLSFICTVVLHDLVMLPFAQSFPVVSKLNDPEGKFGDPTSAITHSHIEPYLEGMSVAQVSTAPATLSPIWWECQ
jgi:hypothetical protein